MIKLTVIVPQWHDHVESLLCYCSPQQNRFIEHELAGDRDGRTAIVMEKLRS